MLVPRHLIDRSALGEEWKETANRVLGIPLYPEGEKTWFEYIQEEDDFRAVRIHIQSTFIWLTIAAACGCIFFRNTYISVRLLYQNPRLLPRWCCFIQAIFGLILVIVTFVSFMPGGLNCRLTLWSYDVGLAVSSMCISLFLMLRAYAVSGYNKLLLYFGTPFFIFQLLTVVYYWWRAPVTITSEFGCVHVYGPLFFWILLAVNVTMNACYSLVFIIAVYRQYKIYGSKKMEELTYQGIKIMLAIILCDTLTILGMTFDIFHLPPKVFFTIDWVINSILLVKYCSIRRENDSTLS